LKRLHALSLLLLILCASTLAAAQSTDATISGVVMSRQNSDLHLNQADQRCIPFCSHSCKTGPMLTLLKLLSTFPTRFFRSRRDLLLENLALRQQLAVLRQRRPQTRFAASDRLFWVMLRRFWSGWKQALILVQPETVVQWHRAGFKAYWTWLSRHRAPVGRKRIGIELRDLIFRIIAENPTWGASRIHGELAMLGFTNFNEEVAATVKSLDIVPKRTSFRSPWQNGVGERWVGSCRRDLLDHVIVLNERHLKRLTREYVRYYHDDRTILDWTKQHLRAVKRR
jgi:hypothetical protein